MSKICGICGIDCSDRPRIKDPKGRYYCRTCYDAATHRQDEARQAREAAANALDPVALEEPAAAACPGCGQELPEGAVLCTACGYNLQTGASVAPPTLAPEAATAAPSTPGRIWPIVIGVIAILLAAAGLLGPVLELLGGEQAGGRRSRGLLLGGGLNLLHLIGGLGVLFRKPVGVTLLRIWAWIAVVLLVLVGTCLGIGLALSSGRLQEIPELGEIGGLGVGLAVAVLLAVLAIGLAWPVFMILWFRRGVIQDQIGRWV